MLKQLSFDLIIGRGDILQYDLYNSTTRVDIVVGSQLTSVPKNIVSLQGQGLDSLNQIGKVNQCTINNCNSIHKSAVSNRSSRDSRTTPSSQCAPCQGAVTSTHQLTNLRVTPKTFVQELLDFANRRIVKPNAKYKALSSCKSSEINSTASTEFLHVINTPGVSVDDILGGGMSISRGTTPH